ncbi:MAG: apolipoprotein N-acyltransferase [Bacteroidales bacterium]|nr:apolipoprotein N-acyltransferase [Bacteroidales bacterium]
MRDLKWHSKLPVSVASGLLMAFAWYPHGLPFLMFLAFIPLLFLSDASISEGKKNAFGRGILLFYPAFFTFNLITTYWIAYCTVYGAIAAVVLNALLQTLVFALWHSCRKCLKNRLLQAILLVSFWIAFEYLHQNWDLTWPWLSLGNVFATTPKIVQWYSLTGAAGGTLWVLLCNLILHRIICLCVDRAGKRRVIVNSAFLLLAIATPIIVSLAMLPSAMRGIDTSTPVDAVVVQQNTDPWTEEYSLTNVQEIDRLLSLAVPLVKPSTSLVVTPESSVAHGISVDNLRNGDFLPEDTRYSGFARFDSVVKNCPNLNFILGLSTFVVSDKKMSPSATKMASDVFVESYNTAGFYNSNGLENVYHKSRLVPGVEKMPFPRIFGFLGDILIELGGSNSSLGVDTVQRVFTFEADGKRVGVGTAICYESVYGELVGRFVRNGANVIAVITNDSWWKDSQGHRQHFEMARLRAIETRRYVLRAANGGFSGVVDPLGNVLEKTGYDQRTAFATRVYAQNGETFYVRHGDYIARIAAVIAVLGLTASAITALTGVFKRRRK